MSYLDEKQPNAAPSSLMARNSLTSASTNPVENNANTNLANYPEYYAVDPNRPHDQLDPAYAPPADYIYGDITREQWDDYLTRFTGLEDMAIEDYMDPEKRAANRLRLQGHSDDAVNQSFARQQERTDTFRSRSGLGMRSAEEQSIRSRGQNTAKAAAMAKARNDTRAYANDREMAFLLGGSEQ